ncbi:MAG: protein kinase [Chloroflexota bacterium]|nr:protein kinase [Chloroflexota bacterium]
MGVVYRAYDPRLKRRVALKLLAPDLGDNERFRQRFLRECELAASLDHPHIVPIYDAGERDGRLYIAMRYVEGRNLSQLLRERGPLEARQGLAFAAQLADALDAAHERGLVHRDVKPSNVLVDERGHCYLADFGLTIRVSEQGGAGGPTVGTIDYVAPEQIRGEEVGSLADVYSLGCLVYECLTGEPPFRHSSDFAILFAHLHDPPPSVVDRQPALPAPVDAVFARALAKEPGHRFRTCGELVAAAREAVDPGERAEGQRRVRVVAALTAALLVAVALLAFTRLGRSPAAAAGGALVRIDARTNEPEATVPVGEGASAVAASPRGVWVAAYRGSSLWRVNPDTLGAVEVPANGDPQDVAVYGDKVYVAANGPTDFTGNVTEYDVGNGRRIDSVGLSSCASSVAAGSVGVWATPCPLIARLSFDGKPAVVATFAPPPPPRRDAAHDLETLNDMAVGHGSVWVVGDALDRRLWRIDPRSRQVVGTTVLPFAPAQIATGAGAVWITDQLDDRLARLDPASGAVVALIPVGRGASGVAVGAGSVWVTGSLDGTVSRVDPRTNRVVATIRVGGTPVDVAVSGWSVWAAGDAR